MKFVQTLDLIPFTLPDVVLVVSKDPGQKPVPLNINDIDEETLNALCADFTARMKERRHTFLMNVSRAYILADDPT